MAILKHIDFEVPAWGELAAGPTHGSPVVLSQHADASFPDRGAVGLKIVCTSGTGSGYVQHDLGADTGLVHVRVLLNFDDGSLSGDAISVVAAYSDGPTFAWALSIDPDARQAILAIDVDDITADLPGVGVPWVCIEVMIDADGGEAQMWLNGVHAGTITGTYSGFPTRYMRVGGIFKQTNTVGDLYIDEIVIGDDYIGPVIVSPGTGQAATDPARWLVIYNLDVAESIEWAEGYRALRGVPHANLLGVALGTEEQIDESASNDLLDAISNYLSLNGLDTRIVGLIIGYACPGVISTTPARSLASRLRDLSDDTEDADNEDHVSGVADTEDLPDRDTLTEGARYLVGEINAVSLASAQALSTNIDALTAADAAGRSLAALDPETDQVAEDASGWASASAWIGSLAQQGARLPVATGYAAEDGHGHSIELLDSIDGAHGEVDQTRVLMGTIADEAALGVMP